MAFDVVTAKQGKPHVTADQQALMQAGMLGKGRYALDALNNLACTMTDSNTLTVDTGGLMVDGRWVVNEAQTSFAIANGSQAQFRKDLAVLEITVDPSTGVTSLEEKVLQGATAATAAAAADPTYEAGDLYTGLTAVVPIARITLDGLTPTCKALLPSVADLKTISEQIKKLGDSVSPASFAASMMNISSQDKIYGVKTGGIVSLWVNDPMTLSKEIPAWSSMQIATIPDGFRPAQRLRGVMVSDSAVGAVVIDPDGSVIATARNSKLSGNIVLSASYLCD